MTCHRERRAARRTGRVALVALAGAVAPAAVGDRAMASPPTTEATTVVVDDTGAVAISLPSTWVDVATGPNDYGNGSSPSIMASPDNQALVNSFSVPGVLVTVPADPGTHEELMGSFGLPEGCVTLVTEDFADSTLTGIVQKGEDCGGTGAVWRTIIGDTADGQTVVAQGQAPSALGLAELNAALASVVVTAVGGDPVPAHAGAGVSTPMTGLVDATASIALRVPATWSDVGLDPFDFGTGAAQPYLFTSTDRQVFLDTFDAPGLLVTIPNGDATDEELLADFGLQAGCSTIEVVPYADGTLTGVLQRGDGCGASGAVWRTIVGDTGEGRRVVVAGQASSPAGTSELEEAIGSLEIIAEPGPDDAVVPDATSGPATSGATVAGPYDDVFGPAPSGLARVVDDTATLTLLVPEAWSSVDTYELAIDDGKPRIMATSDLAAFQGDGDAGGALLIAEAYDADPAALVGNFSRESSCARNEEMPFDDGTYAGWMWLGEGCGPSGTGTWIVLAASPADRSATLRFHLRSAAGEDELVAATLSSFSLLPPGVIAAATLPDRVVPAGASPANIGQAFLDALRFGDGDGACSLLDPTATGNVGLSIRGCGARITTRYPAAGLADAVVVGEPTVDGVCNASDSSDPSATTASVEFAVAESGCISFERDPGGEWLIVDFSGAALTAGT